MRRHQNCSVFNLSLILLLFCSIAANADWFFNDTSAYLAIFKVDYSDPVFEGGYLYTFKPIQHVDTLPIKMTFSASWDFANVYFNFVPSNASVFSAGVVWMGTGNIVRPESFDSANLFSTVASTVQLPSKIRYYYHEPLDSSYEISFAWNAINRLNVVQNLLQRGSQVGMYLYPPSVGAFNPSNAKVIVFIFSNAVYSSILQPKTILPKPCYNTTKTYMNESGKIIMIRQMPINLQGRKIGIH